MFLTMVCVTFESSISKGWECQKPGVVLTMMMASDRRGQRSVRHWQNAKPFQSWWTNTTRLRFVLSHIGFAIVFIMTPLLMASIVAFCSASNIRTRNMPHWLDIEGHDSQLDVRFFSLTATRPFSHMRPNPSSSPSSISKMHTNTNFVQKLQARIFFKVRHCCCWRRRWWYCFHLLFVRYFIHSVKGKSASLSLSVNLFIFSFLFVHSSFSRVCVRALWLCSIK